MKKINKERGRTELLQRIHEMWERVMPMREEYWKRLLEDSAFIDDFFEKSKEHFLKNS